MTMSLNREALAEFKQAMRKCAEERGAENVFYFIDEYLTASIATSTTKIWHCKIGEVPAGTLPDGADLPMRLAIREAYLKITGVEPLFIFSGWAGELDAIERQIVNEEYA